MEKITTLNTSKSLDGSSGGINYEELKKLILVREKLLDAASAIKSAEGTVKRQRTRIEELEKLASENKKESPAEIQAKIDAALKEENKKTQALIDAKEEEVRLFFIFMSSRYINIFVTPYGLNNIWFSYEMQTEQYLN